jgi:hypothetical protein
MNYIFILNIIISLIILFIFYYFNIYLNKTEHFCKFPKVDPITGTINNNCKDDSNNFSIFCFLDSTKLLQLDNILLEERAVYHEEEVHQWIIRNFRWHPSQLLYLQ